MKNVLEAFNVSKTYDGINWALRDFTLTVNRGELVSLLGRNGAGKTTFINIATTQLRQTSGTVRILDYDVFKDAKNVRKLIAVVPQEARPLSLATPWEHVYYYLSARGLSMNDARERTTRYLREMDLWEHRNVICSKLSGGLRQRVLVTMAIAAEAEVTFLDEPTIGLDPISKINVWKYINQYAKRGFTFILTTQDMEEAEVLSNRIAIMDRGRLLTYGDLQSIKFKIKPKIRVEIKCAIPEAALRKYGQVINLGDKLLLYVDEDHIDEVAKLVLNQGCQITISPIRLEDVFISLVGGSVHDEA
ncbi:MAG: ABC transporter ATP-binding protein [Nitrososphaerota archaeon]